MERVKAEAFARARAQIAERITRFCVNLPPAELEVLLDRMAGIQCKYESFSPVKPRARVSGERHGHS